MPGVLLCIQGLESHCPLRTVATMRGAPQALTGPWGGLETISVVSRSKWEAQRGTWVAPSVEHLTSAQVLIARFVSSSPTSDSVLTAQSLEPVLDSVSPTLSAPSLLTLCLCLSQKQINIKKLFKKMGGPELLPNQSLPLVSHQLIFINIFILFYFF